jgi:hypothetical protein
LLPQRQVLFPQFLNQANGLEDSLLKALEAVDIFDRVYHRN